MLVVLVVVIGGAVSGAGSVSRCTVDDRVNATFVPPKNGLRTGVSSWNRPVTVTVTRLPMPVGQPVWLQVTAMSDGLTLIPLPFSSSCTRHRTRLLSPVEGHGFDALKSVGVLDAWNAPSLAAFATDSCAAARRPRSSVVAKNSMNTGRRSANSTRLWPRERSARCRRVRSRRRVG